MTIYDTAPDGEDLTQILNDFYVEDNAIEFAPKRTRVTNLLYLIDELGLNQCEMSDLSAGIFTRMVDRARCGGSMQ